MANKLKTNEQLLKALVKDICDTHPFYAVLLRERLQKISAITRQAIAENPTSFDNPMIDHIWFLAVCDKIDEHLGKEKD
jgi:hypothetical protein